MRRIVPLVALALCWPVAVPAERSAPNMPRSPRTLALDIAYHHLGTAYSWGGDDSAAFDCSGYVSDILKSVGVLRRGERLTAQQFHDRYKSRLVRPPAALQPGMLVFWARPDGSIRHVELVYDILTDGTTVTIGASGGGPHVKTLADAVAANAFVQVRALAPDWVAAVDIFP